MWKRIRGICAGLGLEAHRADESVDPAPIMVNILDELERAQIIIADLTDFAPNVLYELGIAHARCENVVLLAKRGEDLPFDLASLRCHFYEWTPNGKDELFDALGRTLRALKSSEKPTVIDTYIERTEAVLADLKQLTDLPDADLRKQEIWFSGFLSSFAISDDLRDLNAVRRALLLQEQKMLLDLAGRGCKIRCIIAPTQTAPLEDGFARRRLRKLADLLMSNEPALSNVDWVVSPFLERSNFYVIGGLCCTEGFRAGGEGFNLTLRQTGRAAIEANLQMLRILFDRLRTYTLTTYPAQSSTSNENEALRASTLRCVLQVLNQGAETNCQPLGRERYCDHSQDFRHPSINSAMLARLFTRAIALGFPCHTLCGDSTCSSSSLCAAASPDSRVLTNSRKWLRCEVPISLHHAFASPTTVALFTS